MKTPKVLSRFSKGSLEAMNAIRENTEPIPQIYELLQTIKRDGLKAI